MGPTWGPSWADRIHVGPYWLHVLCYLGYLTYWALLKSCTISTLCINSWCVVRLLSIGVMVIFVVFFLSPSSLYFQRIYQDCVKWWWSDASIRFDITRIDAMSLDWRPAITLLTAAGSRSFQIWGFPLKSRPSYLSHENPYTGETTSSYWEGLLDNWCSLRGNHFSTIYS